MWHKVRDLSIEQRRALEGLLGRGLREDEALNIYSSRLLQDAPAGKDRDEAFHEYLADLDRLAERAKYLADEELDALADAACEHARHPDS
jgi:hypothetical protein